MHYPFCASSQPDFYLNNDQPVQPSGGWVAYLLNFRSTGFLFEHRSTGATIRRTDCLPANGCWGCSCLFFV
ncbi:MAG: hypothetical protein LBT09_04430 [Planctomycetaceae bacterium]|nr:hypothetical protein [Planctomycetaceae bacterium]